MDEDNRRILTQEDCDQWLMMEASKPGMIDLATNRDDAVVERMLRMRDAGDHPSVISDSSVIPERESGNFGRQQEPVMASWGQRRAADIGRISEGLEDEEELDLDQYDSASVRRPTVPKFRRTPEYQKPAKSQVQQQTALSSRRSVVSDVEPRRTTSRPAIRSPRMDDDDFNDFNEDFARLGAAVSPEQQPQQPSRAQHTPVPRAASRNSDDSFLSRSSGLGRGQDIAQRFSKPAETPFASFMQKQMRELQAPAPLPEILPVLPPNQARSTASMVSQSSDQLLDRIRRRHKSPDSAIESSVSHPDRSKRSNDSRRGERRDRRERRDHRRDRDSQSRSSTKERDGRRRSSSRDERRKMADRQNRREVMLELDKLRVEYVGDESTWELEHLYERRMANDQLVSKVAFVKTIIKVGATLIELAIGKFLPQIKLRGWAEGLSKDLATGNYDNMLEQVYRKTWKKGPPNVWLSLAMLILGSAALHCIGLKGQNDKAGGGGPMAGIGNILGMLGNVFGGGGGGGGAATGSFPIRSAAAARRNETAAPQPSAPASPAVAQSGVTTATQATGTPATGRRRKMTPA